MRALTKDEAEALRGCGSGVTVVPGGTMETAIFSAEKRGCLRRVPRGSQWPGCWRTEVTDLGRLALRVSLPLPSVLP